MAGGRGKIEPKVGKNTRFTSDNQPENRGRKPDTISGFLKQELKGDGFAVMQFELVDEKTKKPTGHKAWGRVKLTTGEAIAKRLLANANAGRERSIEMVLERTEGKVPQENRNLNEEVNNFDYSKLTDKELDTFLALSEKAKRE